MGKGLNVPSTLSCHNTYPRKHGKTYKASEAEIAKFVNKLKGLPDTEFIHYDADNGIWTFKVQHYTTYGLESDDDEDCFNTSITAHRNEGMPGADAKCATNQAGSSPTATPHHEFTESFSFASEDDYSLISGGVDDTFDFKKRNIQFAYSRDDQSGAPTEHDIPEQEWLFHACFKPRFAGLDQLVCLSNSIHHQDTYAQVRLVYDPVRQIGIHQPVSDWQIGRDDATRRLMDEQIRSWRANGTWSEIPDSLRTIYSLLAGKCLACPGTSDGPLEDRTTGFLMSNKYQLTWKQAFGLRLWYGTTEEASVEEAVAMFNDDLHHNNESATPMLQSEDGHSIADPLWTILKAYARSQLPNDHGISVVHLPQDLCPSALSNSNVRARLSFELYQHLARHFESDPAVVVDQQAADQLTCDYAWELSLGGQVLAATFVLLHLSDSQQRTRTIQTLLAKCAPSLPCPSAGGRDINPVWASLCVDLQIPAAWLWTAKALAARSEAKFAQEVEYLLNAEVYAEAHETLCRTVAPDLVIERDYVTLQTLIDGFGSDPETKVESWHAGGAIYADFVHLATSQPRRRNPGCFVRLVRALTKMKVPEGRGGQDRAALRERAAIRDMSELASAWAQDVGAGLAVDPKTILDLPMTQKQRMTRTVQLTQQYFEAVMAGGS
ncbi:hypothetical protein KEM52_006261 [Ascosphaera acerosa]|nr:hypothetical protein KEM52_006261 [Ascosphaera acerosa]